MRFGKLAVYIFLSAVLFLLMMMSCSVYIQLKPPESVVLVAFRMPYQMFSRYITLGSMVGSVLYFAVVWVKETGLGKYSLFLAAGFLILGIMGVVYSVRIASASAQVSGMQYGTIQINNTGYQVEQQDLHREMHVPQCSVSTPVDSPYADKCVIYLNYGGWSVQDENMGSYLEELVTNAGYSYVRFAGTQKEQGNISDIVRNVKECLKKLVEEKQYQKTVLIGGSAGGNIALITAFANELPEVYGESFLVNGVIGLYPMTNMESAYDYFVEQAKADSLLGKLGDKLYCGLYGNGSGTGTFAGETKSLDEAVFGIKGSKGSFYQKANVLKLVGSQNIPTLLIGGNADSMVVVEDTRKLYEYMKEKGLDCAYLELPNVEHAFDLVDNAARQRACVEIRNWLNVVL